MATPRCTDLVDSPPARGAEGPHGNAVDGPEEGKERKKAGEQEGRDWSGEEEGSGGGWTSRQFLRLIVGVWALAGWSRGQLDRAGYRSGGGRLVLSCPGLSSFRQEVLDRSQTLASW